MQLRKAKEKLKCFLITSFSYEDASVIARAFVYKYSKCGNVHRTMRIKWLNINLNYSF